MNPIFDWKPCCNSILAFQRHSFYYLAFTISFCWSWPPLVFKTLLHPRIVCGVKRKVAVSFDVFFLWNCFLDMLCLFTFFILHFSNTADNKCWKERVKGNLHLHPRVEWRTAIKSELLACSHYIRCKEFVMEFWLSVLKYNCSLTIPSLLRVRGQGYTQFLVALHFLNSEFLT